MACWFLLKYGHFCQAEPTDAEQTDNTPEKYAREADSWRIAEAKLTEQPFY